jgi:(p)ppGpp synthase/HD superfamily hydrolase
MPNSKPIKNPPGFELFFAPLAVELGPTALESIQFAYIASKYGHALQVRDDGSRYFDHPKAVAWIYINELGGRDPRVICDALLHDVLEDTYLLSTFRINLNFGKEVALDVRAITKLPKGKELIEAYLRRIIERGPWVILVKLCDRLHNLRSLSACTKEKRLRQIAETKSLLLPMLIPALRSYGGEWRKLANTMREKMEEAIAKRQLK